MKKLTTMLAALALLGLPAAAETISFGYGSGNEAVTYGTAKAETYEVAISLAEPALAGMQLTAIQVPVIPDTTGYVTDLKIWLTRALTVELVDGKNTTVPDIATYEVDMPEPAANGAEYVMVNVDLDEPLTVDGNSLYVGYSLTVKKAAGDESTNYPIVLEQPGREGGFWLRASRSFRQWTDKATTLDAVSKITVSLEGTVPASAAGIVSVGTAYAPKGVSSTIDVEVSNAGSSAISSLEYTTTVAGKTNTAVLDLSSNPVEAILGARRTVALEIPAIDEVGTLPVTVSIDKVNGVANSVATNTAESSVVVLPFVPVNRPLMEEFTGTGCGYCPRGLASMDYMNENYPGEFLCVAWHGYNSTDPMNPACGVPDVFSGAAPDAYMNRVDNIDPYYAASNSGYQLPTYWNNYRSQYVPCDIDVTAEWADDAETQVEATATIYWAEEAKGEYRVEFILTGDDLYGEDSSWNQSNYYKGDTSTYLMEWWGQQGSSVAGVHFNDVGLLTSGFGGIEGSIESISLDTPNTVSYTLNTQEALNRKGNLIDFNPSKLRVVAIVLKVDGSADGQIVNANRVDVPVPTAIKTIDSKVAKDVKAVEYYDLQGRKVTNPTTGIYVKKNVFTDGTSTVEKISVK
ncbi:MAG: hypothetical protein LIO90_08520 [Bacteroidales bacterium]|nr:hypothetical protein [Bacteroidales bacterium]